MTITITNHYVSKIMVISNSAYTLPFLAWSLTFLFLVGIIKAACSSNLQMCLFSATMSGAVEKFGQKHFKNGFTCSIGKEGNSVSKNVHQKVIYCGDER